MPKDGNLDSPALTFTPLTEYLDEDGATIDINVPDSRHSEGYLLDGPAVRHAMYLALADMSTPKDMPVIGSFAESQTLNPETL